MTKTAVILLLSIAAVSCAQDRKVENKTPDSTHEKKRLASVTWDLKTHKLLWVVQKGTEQGGEFVPSGSDSYEISPDDAVMAFSNQKRGFTQEEAASLHKLLDTLSLYCAESVIWWDQGEGTPLDGPSGNAPDKSPRKTPKDQETPPKRERVKEAPTPSAPSHATLVARAMAR